MKLRVFLFVATAFYCCVADSTSKKFSLLMPNVRPTKAEQYLCTSLRLDDKKPYYVTAFEPNATMQVAHHMLLFGCSSPGSESPLWNCGRMLQSTPKEGRPCAKDRQIIYAWAMDAPRLELPEGVGFKVGGDSPIQYLVLEMHYLNANPHKDVLPDSSGVHMHYTEQPLDKIAGVILLKTGGEIPPHKTELMESDCTMNEPRTIYPFAFRTHTHKLGRLVEGYKVEHDEQGDSHWTLLGRKNPQLPQMFYPTFTNEPIKYGDTLAARCVMVSDRETVTFIGQTSQDEMCNFYLMFYVKSGNNPLITETCYTPGPPSYYWNNSSHLNNIPDYEP